MHEGGVLWGRVAARPDRPHPLGGADHAPPPAAPQAAQGPAPLAPHAGQGAGPGRGFERDRRREEPDGAVLMAPVAGPDRLQVGPGLGRPDMHLPVGGKEEPPHASSSAATPGSGLPSRNSSEAPPPVETWVSLDARPATAAAESPPPTTVVAPRRGGPTLAPAAARGPASNGGCPKNPPGPVPHPVLSRATRGP